MNAKAMVPAAPLVLLALLLCSGPLAAQSYDPNTSRNNPLLNQYGSPFVQPLGPGLEDPLPFAPTPPPVMSLSPYILGATSHPAGCCGPSGADGPISWELYMRNGLAISFGNPFSADLHVGWAIQGGARTLFYNPEQTSAWVIDLGIMNIYQNCAGENTYRLVDFPERIGTGNNAQNIITPEKFLTGDYLNRTLVGLSIGHEVWLLGSPRMGNGCGGCGASGGCGSCGRTIADAEWNWRAGWDVGGRYGTTKFMPNEARHQNERLGGFFLAAHTDIEIPCGACVFQTGVRMEWAYTWNDVIQSQNRNDIQDIFLMWNLGVRF